MRFSLALIVALCLLPATVSKSFAAIVLQEIFAYAETSTDNEYTSISENAPYLHGQLDVDGASEVNRARIEFDFENTGSHATLDGDWTYYLNGLKGSAGYAFVGITFAVDADTQYSVVGELTSTGDASTFQAIEIYEYYAAEDIPYSFQLGRLTSGGGEIDQVVGSPTGILTAGNTYQAYGLYAIQAFENGASSNALASLHLAFDEIDSPAVPEPTTLVTWAGLGLAGFLMRRRTFSSHRAGASRNCARLRRGPGHWW